MSVDELESSDGLVIIALQIRDEDRRGQAVHRLENLPGERLTAGIFQIPTSNWDEDLWDEEVEWFNELLEGTRDRVIVWRFDDGRYSRFTIGNSG